MLSTKTQKPSWNLALEVKLGRMPRVYHESDDPNRLVPIVWSPDDYQIDTVSVPGRLKLYGIVPLAERTINGIEIDVTAGYGASSVDGPSPLRRAMMMLVAHWFEHRGVVGHDGIADVSPQGFDALIAPYRILSL